MSNIDLDYKDKFDIYCNLNAKINKIMSRSP
jgi:hypothetical protein